MRQCQCFLHRPAVQAERAGCVGDTDFIIMASVWYSVRIMWTIFLIFLSQIICIKAMQCPDPNVDNAVKLSGNIGSYSINTVVKFRCKKQYKLIGSDTVKCNQSSKWEPELPMCLGICTFPTHFSFAELEVPTTQSVFLEGAQLKYKCKRGYERISGAVDTITCSKFQWSPFELFCKPITCVGPPFVPNGRLLSGSSLHGNRITYACETGYKFKNINYRTCLSDGSWSLPIPECEGICKPPPVLYNAQLHFQYQTMATFFIGTVVQYMCRPGFYQDHGLTNSITCLKTLTWSNISNDFCKLYTCPSLGNVKNGWYAPELEEYLQNDTVTYDCHEGFQLVGKASIICGHDGRWKTNPPECRGICDNPPDLHYAQLDIRSKAITTFFAGSTVQYNCKRGYIQSNYYRNSIACLGNFTWSEIPKELCKRRSCGHPPKVSNAVLEVKDFLFESNAIYKCEKGYKMVSIGDSLNCGPNGGWTGTLPLCEVQKCLPPEDLQDGSYRLKKNDYTYNETVTYKCNTLQLIGKASVSCTDEGKWSSGAPQCRAACIFPPKLDFAVLVEEEEFADMGKSVQYKCRPGFVPVTGKNNNLTCLENLKWSQNEIFCTPISCGDPGDIDNGQMQAEEFVFGSRVYYTCNPGYSMVSKRNYRECQVDGTWSGKPPVCKEPTCDQIWELQEESRKCTSTPDEWIKYLQVQYLYLQIQNLKLDNEIKKRQLRSPIEDNPKSEETRAF
ncbi:complement receptor type 1-like isoform 2-T2 [Anomaloglossus baeobatrachus]|uniref:complement receptor type 1-like isoform X2 n=1 Tax=Anomaloglossus baeobatrachus TaxID=238106 RepID=UPI003F4F5C21